MSAPAATATGGDASQATPAPAPAPAPSHPAPSQTSSQIQSHRGGAGPTIGFTLPSRYTLDFGRLNSDYFIRNVTLNIANQDTLSGATYDQLMQLTRLDLPITRDNFIRMWKTLILKRAQDVYENEKCQRPDNFVRLIRNIPLPAPLADLLFSLGSQLDPTSGITYHMVPPDRPAAVPNWWNVDADILARWIMTMNRMQHLFVMKEFPSVREYEGRPLMLTAINDAQGYREIKAKSNVPKPADAFIRFVNDDLFAQGPAFDTCHLRMTEPMLRIAVVHDYLRDYCLDSNV